MIIEKYESYNLDNTVDIVSSLRVYEIPFRTVLNILWILINMRIKALSKLCTVYILLLTVAFYIPILQ